MCSFNKRSQQEILSKIFKKVQKIREINMQIEEIQNIYNEAVPYREMKKNFEKVEAPPPPQSIYCDKMKNSGKQWKKQFLDRFGYHGFYLLIIVILLVGSFLVYYFALNGKFFVVSLTLKSEKVKKETLFSCVFEFFLQLFTYLHKLQEKSHQK